MLNLDEIDSTINELENGPTTFDACAKLASLYAVREHLATNAVEIELNDILPQYKVYCEVKRKYQLNQLTDTAVYNAMEDVCREITEFIQTLYSSTDTQRERDSISKLCKTLNLQYGN